MENELIEIDLNNIQSIEDFHRTVKLKLDFPEFYGMNWDAFWDSITSIVKMPKILKFKNQQAFNEKFPRDSKILKKIITDFNSEIDNSKILIE